MCSSVRGSSGGNNRSNGSASSSGSGMSLFTQQFITGRPLPALPTAPTLPITTSAVTSSPSPVTTISTTIRAESTTTNNAVYTAKDRLVRLIEECHMKVKRDEIRVQHRIQRFGDI